MAASQAADPQVASRILSTVKAKGVTYAELGRKMGVTATTVWNWAEGNHGITIGKLAELASFLNVSPSFLAFGYEHSEEKDNSVVSVPEVSFNHAGVMRILRDWKISKKFVERTLRYDPESLVLFENQSGWVVNTGPGDVIICNLSLTDPKDDGAGVYLIFGDGSAVAFYLALFSESGVKPVSQTSLPVPPVFEGGGWRAIGKVVGIIKSS